MSSPRRASSSGQEVPTSLESNTSLDDRRKERFEYFHTSVSLYQAALKGDWQAAKAILENHPHLVRHPITEWGETALHIAVLAKHVVFVKELVNVEDMTPDDMALRNNDGCTALCFAAFAAGPEIVSIAQEMVKKNKGLPLVRAYGRKTPLYMAALHGRREMVSYLYPLTPFKELDPMERIDILVATISTDMYDIALDIQEQVGSLATIKDAGGEIAILKVLVELARKPSAIGSRSQLSVWERCLNNSWFKGMCNKALMKTLAHKLVELLWREVLVEEDLSSKLDDNRQNFLFEAAKLGNVEFLIILLRSNPNLIWKLDEESQSIFHIAVKHRQESVFNLIYEIGTIGDMIAKYTVKEENTILHLAGQLAPLDRRNIIPGAPLQMQRELLWFEKIKKIVQPSYEKKKNKGQDGKTAYTPWELFIKEHEDLKKQGEKWMKDTANYCMLVATLIATVVFAAAFTVPGGNNQETGTPIFLKNNWFMVFFISDAMAMLSSSTSILIFLSILTSRFVEENFLKALPKRLLFGLTTLFISIASMVTAFGATWFLAYNSKMAWVPITITALAVVPVSLFVVLHYQLWVDIIYSTYLSSSLFRPPKHRLF